MSCPSVAELLGGAAAEHVRGCSACRAILALAQTRQSALDCGRAEALMAARAAGSLAPANEAPLLRHLESCADCRSVAGELEAPELTAALASVQGDGAYTELTVVAELAPGTHVQRYQILRRVGVGGMGVVYAARDPEIGRVVAIKVVRPTRANADARARLVREARAMAKVSHPGVISIYDAGTVGDEVFIVMEYIVGTTLGAWLQAGRRSWREVLACFIDAGRALAAAHAAGVVHRDFKPDNVLVHESGRVCVADFGLARAAAEGETAALVEHVKSGDLAASAIAGTPAYMAPEQHMGRPVDARCDQFSFCVALWEGLYGVLPFAAESRVRMAVEVLSSRIQPPPAGAGVPRWLERILRRGLSVAPVERFSSMSALLHELERDRRRTVRRALGGVGLVAVVGGAIALAVIGREPPCGGGPKLLAGVWDSQARAAMEHSFLQSGTPFAADTFQRVATRLDEWAGGWQGMHRDACLATAVRKEQSEALLDLRMGCLSRKLEEVRALTTVLRRGDAVEHAVQSVRALPAYAECADAAALTAAFPPSSDPRVAELRQVLARAKALSSAGKDAEALPLLRPMPERARATGYLPLQAEALFALARNLQDTNEELPLAESSLREGIRVGAAAKMDRSVAKAWTSLMWVLSLQRRYPEALALRTAAEAALERAGNLPELRYFLAHAVGKVYEDLARYDDAIPELQRAVTLGEEAFGKDDDEITFPLGTLVEVYGKLGRHEESLAAARRILSIRRALYGEAHPSYADALDLAGRGHVMADRLDEAMQAWKQAVAILEPIESSHRHTLEAIFNNMASVLLMREKYAEAVPYLERSIALAEKVSGPDSVELVGPEQNLAQVEVSLGDFEKARRRLERAYALRKKAFPPDHEEIGESLWTLALVDLEEGKLDAAVDGARQAVAILEKVPGGHVASALEVLGEALTRQGRAAEAIPALERARQIMEKRYGEGSLLAASVLCHLGEALLEHDEAGRALPLLERAVQARSKIDGDLLETGEPELALARALGDAGKDHARARRLAESAKAHFVAAGPRGAKWRAKADAWLARH